MRLDSEARRIAAGRASLPFRPRNSVRSPVTDRRLARDADRETPRAGRTPAGTRCAPAARPCRVAARDDVQLRAGAVFAEHPFHVQRHRVAGGAAPSRCAASGGTPSPRRSAARTAAASTRARRARVRRRCSPGHAARCSGWPPPAGSGVADQNSPGLLVADEDRFAGRIADGIVSPGRQPVVVAVARPRVAGAALGGDESERRVRDDVRPGLGGSAAGVLIDGDDVLAPVVGKPADAVEQLEAVGSAALARDRSTRPGRRGVTSGIWPGSGPNGICGRFSCSRRLPSAPSITTRAAASSSVRSSGGIRSARRRNTPPGRSTQLCSGPLSTICSSVFCRSCR